MWRRTLKFVKDKFLLRLKKLILPYRTQNRAKQMLPVALLLLPRLLPPPGFLQIMRLKVLRMHKEPRLMEEVTLKESSITQTAGEISTKVTEVNKKVTEANTAATNAKNSATSASGSAGTASGKAGEAANSAANAKQSADNAAKVLEALSPRPPET